QLIDDFSPDLIIASGPISLLKKVKNVSEIRGIPLYLVLEEMMGCGVGVCLSCAISLKGEKGLKRVRLCREGLVWNAREVTLPES
ncbi:MAG: dihydroorotate dehydrogenase electron transfer subunit, partial [Caldiserica bacterium]|nr:dihydroorotate dehydrogenase electron transfer subunit [Caldisericota bacterium]